MQQGNSGGAILVLTGPAGSGKTTVLRKLAQEMDLQIIEWINSVNENSVIQRPTMPGQDKWRPGSIDDGNNLFISWTLNLVLVVTHETSRGDR